MIRYFIEHQTKYCVRGKNGRKMLGSLLDLSKNIELSILQKVASTECDPDQPSIVFEGSMASEEDCVELCNFYANSASFECTFAAWEKKTLMGICHLYNEPFSTYLSHCDVISGPPDVSGCLVEHPDENSCHGVR